MTNEQAVEWARRAKSTCNTSIDGDAATLLHWTDNDPVVAQAIADLRIAVGSSIDHKARQAYIQTIEDQPMRYGIISRKDAVIVKGAQLSAASVAELQAAASKRKELTKVLMYPKADDYDVHTCNDICSANDHKGYTPDFIGGL